MGASPALLKWLNSRHGKFVLVISALVFVTFLAWLVWFNNQRPVTTGDVFQNSQPTAESNPKPVDLVSKGESSGWTTYEDPQTKISFAVPSAWTNGQSVYQVDGPILYPYTEIIFKDPAKNSDPNYDVSWILEVSTFDKINDEEMNQRVAVSVPGFKPLLPSQQLDLLRQVYVSRSTDGLPSGRNKNIFLPGTNAGVFAFSKPEYIESSNKEFRGIVYFAAMGQDNTSEVSTVATLTDNTNKVIQLIGWADNGTVSHLWQSTYDTRFQPLDQIYKQTGEYADVQQIFDEYYPDLSRSISSKSLNEPAVQNYLNLYQKTLKSVKNI